MLRWTGMAVLSAAGCGAPARLPPMVPAPPADIVAAPNASEEERPVEADELPLVLLSTADILRVPDPSGGVDLDVVYDRYPPEIIRRVVRAAFDEIRPCYQRALASDPEPRTRVTISFSIETDGHVSVALPDSDAPGWALSMCLAEGFERLRFPRCRERVTVTYPLVLRPFERPRRHRAGSPKGLSRNNSR